MLDSDVLYFVVQLLVLFLLQILEILNLLEHRVLPLFQLFDHTLHLMDDFLAVYLNRLFEIYLFLLISRSVLYLDFQTPELVLQF